MTALELDDIQGGVAARLQPRPRAPPLRAGARRARRAPRAGRARRARDDGGGMGRQAGDDAQRRALAPRARARSGSRRASCARSRQAFREGMAARAEALRDDHDAWEPELRDVEVLLTIHAAGQAALADEAGRWRAWLHPRASGLERVHEEGAALLGDDQREHFGFTDGFAPAGHRGGRPRPASAGRARRSAGGPGCVRARTSYAAAWTAAGVARARRPASSSSATTTRTADRRPRRSSRSGATRRSWSGASCARTSPRFRAAVAREAAALGARRATSSRPSSSGAGATARRSCWRLDAPDRDLGYDTARVNDFVYDRDRDGARCPLGAHVRRANPRDALGYDGQLTVRHRILRRGMPYGPALPDGAPPDDGRARAALRLPTRPTIARQFEVDPASVDARRQRVRARGEADAVVGGGGGLTIQGVPRDSSPGSERTSPCRGGEYLWVPGLRALAALAEGLPAGQ